MSEVIETTAAEAVKAPSAHDMVGPILDILIQYGTEKISNDADAKKVVDAAKDALGVTVDITKPASEILGGLRPMIVGTVDQMSAVFANKAATAVDSLDEIYGKETLLTIYTMLKTPQKLIIWMLALTCVAVSAAICYDFTRADTYDYFDLLFAAGVPVVALFAFCTWPIKSLALASLQIGTKAVAIKLERTAKKTKV
ncbi:hypothetical protein PHOBOS_83 [Erwinia phage vB_EamM_Phobos]|uniref:hypothetical protein n=1 Tax=Erwinia phage vB_EamM_Phobos TaxID=1883377 RepID=UPI00081C9E97|nr:hypothetical protein BIZ79_gp083 [Erwinia phage vB_EamM_Phobos]ANZ50273.1 hypothetical protein PHOBOS_83 [Erwinia phage vB_EamM_Phobos]